MDDGINPLNLATLNELKEVLEEGLDELLKEYLSDAPQQLSQLQVAAEAGDIPTLAAVAHSLKGSSGSLGIDHLYRLCAALELEAKGGVVADAMASVAAIKDEFDRAREALASYMAE
jgi:HPt (histidine-containing phosphotransfer) domain-containing protein